MSLVDGLLNQTITSINSTADDGYGDKTKTVVYSDVICRWEESVSEITNSDGETIMFSVKVWLMPDIDIKEGYRVIKDSSEYVTVGIKKMYNLDGQVDHIKAFLV